MVTRTHAATTILLCAAVAIVTACGNAPSAGGAYVARDSAGIEIVESVSPQWRVGEEWQIAERPALDIGLVDGDSMLLFDRVAGAVLLPDGGVVIANQGDNTLRFFDAAGRFVRAIGGTGKGPGQLQGLSSVALRGEYLFAGGSGVTNVYELTGNFVRTIPTPLGSMRGVFADGTLLLRQGGKWPRSAGDRWREYATYHVADENALSSDSVVSLGELSWGRLKDEEPSLVMFGGMGHDAVGDSALYHGWSEHSDIGVFAMDGKPLRRVRRVVAVEAVRRKQRRKFVDAFIAAQSTVPDEAAESQLRRMLANIPVARSLPQHGAIIVDRGGNLWVQQFSVEAYAHTLAVQRIMPPPDPAEWDVFDTGGVWLGSVTMPRGLMPLDIGHDHVLGVYYDEANVERVRMYALTRAA